MAVNVTATGPDTAALGTSSVVVGAIVSPPPQIVPGLAAFGFGDKCTSIAGNAPSVTTNGVPAKISASVISKLCLANDAPPKT